MNRRWFLATLGSGAAIGISGCLFDESEDYPEACPVTQGLNVSPPDKFDESSILSFVSEYEEEYVREEIEETYEEWTIITYPDTSIRGHREEGSGFLVETSTTWTMATGEGVTIEAQPQDQISDTTDPINVDELPSDTELAVDIAQEAVTEGEVQQLIDEEQNYDQLVSQLQSTRDDTGTHHVLVEDTPVSLEIMPHVGEVNDDSIIAIYYVDDAVARRTEQEEETDAPDGTVVECFDRE